MVEKILVLYFQNILRGKKPPRTVNGRARDLALLVRSFSLYGLPATEILVVETKEKSRSCRKWQASDLSPSRSLYHLPGSSQGTRKEYAGRKLVGYASSQMFDVVADVENYNKFVPFCKKSHVHTRDANSLTADLVIGFPPVVESYTSHVTLVRPHLVKAVCTDGKIFNHLLTTWKFSSGLRNNPRTCIIDFYVSFDFNSPLYSHLANLFFNELVRQMESAFYEEAQSRYGKPSIKTIQLRI